MLIIDTFQRQTHTKGRNLSQKQREEMVSYGFFHPYCNAGGGGERVLWQAVKDTQSHDANCKVVVYTGDEDSKRAILANVLKRFNIELDEKRLQFVYLNRRSLVDSSTWPYFTLLGQAIGSVILTLEAVNKFQPDYFIDTMGYPFSYPVVWLLLRIPIVTYTHFPIISEDMLNKLDFSFGSFSGLKTFAKFIYWQSFMFVYTFVGAFVDVALVNSSWTYNHIKSIWTLNDDISILYPPCSTEKFISDDDMKVTKWGRDNEIICLAQFRPEKRHGLIIEEYAKFLKTTDLAKAPKLILIGSIRDVSDEKYVTKLKRQSESFGISGSHIEFILDAKYSFVLEKLKTATYGLNAMWNEHFGIAVVEYVASGLIPIVHASAGPRLDIVVPWDSENQRQSFEETDTTRTGFFFKSEYDPDLKPREKFNTLAKTLSIVSKLSDAEKVAISNRGKQCVLEKFSDYKFDNKWDEALEKIEMVRLEIETEGWLNSRNVLIFSGFMIGMGIVILALPLIWNRFKE